MHQDLSVEIPEFIAASRNRRDAGFHVSVIEGGVEAFGMQATNGGAISVFRGTRLGCRSNVLANDIAISPTSLATINAMSEMVVVNTVTGNRIVRAVEQICRAGRVCEFAHLAHLGSDTAFNSSAKL